jgi:hypothetical protein
MAERLTSKSTKTEILQAYEELLKEKEQLETKVEQVIKEKQAAGTGGGKIIEKGRAAEHPAAPSTIDGIIQTLSVLRPGFGDAVSELSAKLIAEASKLAELRRNVEEEMAQLESLHGLQVTDETLDQLLQEYIEKSNTFETGAKQRQEAFEQEMAEQRKVWQKEQEEHARFVKERNETTKKAEQREAAEYTYDLELRRKLDNDAYEQQQDQLKRALEDFEEAKKKEWAEREKHIAEQEKEFAELKAKVEKFPKELETAVKKAKEEGTTMARRQTKVKTDLRAKEIEGERRIYELKITSLEDVINKQLQQINSLSAQLAAAVKQVQDLAMKAIEGASSTGSLQAVKEIALEQAKNVQKAK